MGTNDQATEQVSAATAKKEWTSPEIITFTAAVETEGAGLLSNDGGGGNIS